MEESPFVDGYMGSSDEEQPVAEAKEESAQEEPKAETNEESPKPKKSRGLKEKKIKLENPLPADLFETKKAEEIDIQEEARR